MSVPTEGIVGWGTFECASANAGIIPGSESVWPAIDADPAKANGRHKMTGDELLAAGVGRVLALQRLTSSRGGFDAVQVVDAQTREQVPFDYDFIAEGAKKISVRGTERPVLVDGVPLSPIPLESDNASGLHVVSASRPSLGRGHLSQIGPLPEAVGRKARRLGIDLRHFTFGLIVEGFTSSMESSVLRVKDYKGHSSAELEIGGGQSWAKFAFDDEGKVVGAELSDFRRRELGLSEAELGQQGSWRSDETTKRLTLDDPSGQRTAFEAVGGDVGFEPRALDLLATAQVAYQNLHNANFNPLENLVTRT